MLKIVGSCWVDWLFLFFVVVENMYYTRDFSLIYFPIDYGYHIIMYLFDYLK